MWGKKGARIKRIRDGDFGKKKKLETTVDTPRGEEIQQRKNESHERKRVFGEREREGGRERERR